MRRPSADITYTGGDISVRVAIASTMSAILPLATLRPQPVDILVVGCPDDAALVNPTVAPEPLPQVPAPADDVAHTPAGSRRCCHPWEGVGRAGRGRSHRCRLRASRRCSER